MKSLSIIISRPPFGMIHAAEALRLANGAASYGHAVSVVLVGDGVLAARRGQRAEETGWTSLSPLLERLAATRQAKVFVDMRSAVERELGEEDLVQGVELVEDEERLASIIAGSEVVTIF